jgi:hypothetical protein
MKKDKLSVDDAILAMNVYKWSPTQIIHRASLGELEFDEKEFIARIKNEKARKRSKKRAYI